MKFLFESYIDTAFEDWVFITLTHEEDHLRYSGIVIGSF